MSDIIRHLCNAYNVICIYIFIHTCMYIYDIYIYIIFYYIILYNNICRVPCASCPRGWLPKGGGGYRTPLATHHQRLHPPHHHLSLHRRLTQLSIGVWVQEGCGRGSGGSRGVSGGGSSILDGYERFPLHPTPRSRPARL